MRIETPEPYGIALATLALSYGALALFVDTKLVRSEHAGLALIASVMVGSMIVIGVAFAVLGR